MISKFRTHDAKDKTQRQIDTILFVNTKITWLIPSSVHNGPKEHGTEEQGTDYSDDATGVEHTVFTEGDTAFSTIRKGIRKVAVKKESNT